MASQARTTRLLVKTKEGKKLSRDEGFRLGMGRGRSKLEFRVEPLFTQPRKEGGFSLARGAQWYLVEAAGEPDLEESPWDLAHRAVQSLSRGVAAAEVPEIVEPDLLQEWTYENRTPLMDPDASFRAREVCQFNDQDPRDGQVPTRPGVFGWHLGDDFSQLQAARETVGEGKRRVRIAHVDTGYDPDHVTLPRHLNAGLQHNFVDGEDPDDASDPARRGLLRNPGHGTGTLGLLAGNRLEDVPHTGPLKGELLGGAPHAEVIPLRVANSVVRFFSSAVARAFEYLTLHGADVVSMSMGGVASRAWTDAINQAYEAGVVMVCAAGNNFGGLPTRFLVYPARYRRVLAACGVMADHRSYTGLPRRVMQGNWGPRRRMDTALAAYTPNMPWAELGCKRIVDMDGQGTSSATPQIAAAAALWLMHHDPQYGKPWMRVEAVRKALFESARDSGQADDRRLGHGILQAKGALAIQPAAEQDLRQTSQDRAGFALFRVLTGLGVAKAAQRGEMFELEAAQVTQQSKALEDLLDEHDVDPDDPPDRISPKARQQMLEALAADPHTSGALRSHLQDQHLTRPQVPVEIDLTPVEPDTPTAWSRREPASPKTRKLRVFAFDPTLDLDLETSVFNHATVSIPWEGLQRGPVGNYLEVVDVDPPSGCAYDPVDLDDPRLLAQQGAAPSEGNPQFHQQMVYAVAMRTITNFEQALGRVALWAERKIPPQKEGGNWRTDFVPRLRIYPHALREANAYYSPERKALLFGYFPASRTDAGKNLPGGMVFTCLSHDIIAHETTHALLDGLHPRFAEPSNPDVLAFHEAFADVVALFQHFSFPEALRHQIARTRGDLSQQNLLGELAQQFGQALGQYGALRDALGSVDPETKKWTRREPDSDDYLRATEPHDRGAVLVAAIFDAFLAIYQHRSRDLFRLATRGTGVLPEGEIPPDLVDRLADEAAKTAQHVLNICIRGLDYCPPVDVTFGEYLRALITADSDLVPVDPHNYRIAFIEAFRRRGIYPEGVRTLSVESLRWNRSIHLEELPRLDDLLDPADPDDRLDVTWDRRADRRQAYKQSSRNCYLFWRWAQKNLLTDERRRRDMGLAWEEEGPDTLARNKKGEVATEIHSVRPARRIAPDGSFDTDLVVEITQRRREPYDRDRSAFGHFQFRGGCTLLIDLQNRSVRYCIRKDVLNQRRLEQQRSHETGTGSTSLRATYFRTSRRDRQEPFALLHSEH